MAKRPTVLMILDGYGLSDNKEHNAVYEGKTPVMDRLMSEYPFVSGNASGLFVGLPDGQMGNSEVGHMNMGAGRIIYQDLTRITKAIEDGDFFTNSALTDAMDNVIANGSDLHLFGLLSDGGVHSHNTHLYALIRMAKEKGIKNIYIHCFMDGRDTPPESGINYVKELLDVCEKEGAGQIATITGRYYAMDRDNRWERVERCYRALTESAGNKFEDPVSAMESSYAEGITDEFVEPSVIVKDGAAPCVKDGDGVIFYNFRPDRAREITRCFCDEEFDHFERGERKKVSYVCFTDYDPLIPNKTVAFRKEEIVNTFGEYLSKLGLKQARIAETEKYAHVTFFFNGGVEEPNEGEDRFLIPSPKVATYDLQPEMSAPGVCEKLCECIRSGKYDVIIINFANGDMVGHTGVEEAAVKAVEAVDECVGKAVEAIKEVDGTMFICADHGNCEQMVDPVSGEPFTAHTTNPVPFILVNADEGIGLKDNGRLCDIVPTLIDLMGLEKPAEMTGDSLLLK